RGRRQEYAAQVTLKASDDWQEVRLQAADFKNAKDAAPLAAWDEIDQLGLRAYADIVQDGKPVRLGGQWAGPMPEFRSVRWIID
ncbi:MAG TPA: hypothetical protein VM238_11165, partial [Phycisphaerae bacterium]|nr:hypothetical protein [Phycisphaerae bacterium]